jgi:hypothetical protein
MRTEITSCWQGSVYTAGSALAEIIKRYGEAEGAKYHPEINCFTYRGWLQRGYRVKRGEKAIRTHTFLTISENEKDEKTGKEKMKLFSVPKNVCLFYYLQVEKINKNSLPVEELALA